MAAVATTTDPFPVVSVKSSLNPRPIAKSMRASSGQPQPQLLPTAMTVSAKSSREKQQQSLKLPELVVKSAPAAVKRSNKNYIYKYKLLPGNNVRVLLGAIRRRPWWHPTSPSGQDNDDQVPSFLWEMYRNPKRYNGSYANVLLNHLQNNNCLVSKKGLYFCVKNYCVENNLDPLKIIPRTYFISMGSNNNELDAFMEYNNQCKQAAIAARKSTGSVPTYAAVTAAPAAVTAAPAAVSATQPEDANGETAAVPTEFKADDEEVIAQPAVASPQVEKQISAQSDDVIWIMKPASKTNRGFGIKVVQGISEVMAVVNGKSSTAVDGEDDSDDEVAVESITKDASKKDVLRRSKEGPVVPPAAGFSNNNERLAALGRDARKKAHREGWIVQEYMTKPLLVSGRKFDIRCYVLITCSKPRGIRGYFFKDAYVRTSCKKYSLDALSDREIHLTNDAVQKYAKSYGKFENGNKLSFDEWQAVIDKDYPSAPPNIVASKILPEIKRISAMSLAAAVASGIGETDISKSFELLGYDYMIDENFEPKLIEINSNPCLEFASPLLEDIISSLIENVVRVAIDTMCPPPAPGHRTKACEAAIAAIESQESKFELLYH